MHNLRHHGVRQSRSAIGNRIVRALVAASSAAAVMVSGPLAATASPSTPYSDPAASGYLGLCDKAGDQVTQGNIDASPFVVNSVSSVAAPAQYRGPDATATLYAFQPRTETPASAWSGEQLTGAARYSNARHPESAATPADSSLANFLAGYPAIWHGFIELRLYLGAPGQPFDSTSYAATDIHVDGASWHTVGGGTVDCHAGKAVSNETLLLPRSQLRARPTPILDTPSRKSGQGPSGRGSVTGAAANAQPADGTTPRPGSADASSVADSHSSTSTSTSVALGLLLAVILILLLGGGLVLVRRRRI